MSRRTAKPAFAIFISIIAAASFLGAMREAKAYSIFMDNPNTYSGGNCAPELSTRENHWSSVKHHLTDLGWGVQYYSNADAWASDFIDNAFGGWDATGADNTTVAIFDGHGNVNDLAFSYSDSNGKCNAGSWGNLTESNISMGQGYGAQSHLLILDTCCYMTLGPTMPFVFTFGGFQELGFGSLSDNTNGQTATFYDDTQNGTNWYYWLHDLEDKPGWWTGDNTTVVLTRGSSASDVTYRRNYCKFKAETCLSGPLPGQVPYAAGDYIDHGCGGCAVCNL